MTRLPPRLQPLWPLVKRAHRAGARGIGAVSRRARPGALPHGAAATARESAALEPGAVRFHSARAAQRLSRPVPDGVPAGHWAVLEALQHEVPETFVLELRGGSATGPHTAITTPGGLLEAETSHYFGIHGWREHPVFLSPRAPQVEHVDGTVLALAARVTGHNYYHFLIDALPRLGILEDAMPGELDRVDVLLVDEHTRYQRELVAMLGLDRFARVAPRRGRAVRAERLLVPSLPNTSTVVAPRTTAWLRASLPPRTTSGLPRRLYVTRGEVPHTRRLLGERALVERLTRRGFSVIDPGALGVQEQIDHFAAAEVVVAPHGAALTNLSFARPGVRLLELFAPGYLNPGYWSILANIPDSRYRYLVAPDSPASRSPRPGPPMLGVMHDIDLAASAVEDALDLLLDDAQDAA